MSHPISKYSLKQKLSSLLMAMALIWLTVSLPIVTGTQSAVKAKSEKAGNIKNSSDNPFANTTEEKTASVNSISEEYLHHNDDEADLSTEKLVHTHFHNYKVYIAFHGELISPPPEA